jgi:hypothetical protein
VEREEGEGGLKGTKEDEGGLRVSGEAEETREAEEAGGKDEMGD